MATGNPGETGVNVIVPRVVPLAAPGIARSPKPWAADRCALSKENPLNSWPVVHVRLISTKFIKKHPSLPKFKFLNDAYS